jgi:hypothetical protein
MSRALRCTLPAALFTSALVLARRVDGETDRTRRHDPDRIGAPNCLLHAHYDAARPFFSQSLEDGALLRILGCIGHGGRKFFEFGAQDAMEVNTRLLREEFGWSGHYLDGGEPNPGLNLHHAFFNASNIVGLMRAHGVSLTVDLLSVDCDFDDFYLLREILLAGYRPRLLIGEFNAGFMLNQAYSVRAPHSLDDPRWQGDCYTGVSALGLVRLASAFGYGLVHAQSPNLFFVHVGSAKARGLTLPEASSLIPTVPKVAEKSTSSTRPSGSRCDECGATWTRIPPTSALRPLAMDRSLGPEDFAAALPAVTLAFRRVHKRFHLSSRHQQLEHTMVYREVPAPLLGAECTSWKRPVIAKPNPRSGRPDSARQSV